MHFKNGISEYVLSTGSGPFAFLGKFSGGQLENMDWTLDWTLDWTGLDWTGVGVNFLESVSLKIVTRGQHSSIWLHFSLI